jgi:histidinol-phosphate aminotransferase
MNGCPPNEWMKCLPSYEPGRPLEEVARELGLDGIDDIIKLASNENSLGPSPRAVAAIQAAAPRMHLYPDGGGFYLKQALARKIGIDAAHIQLGNGSNELIELLGHIFLGPGTEIVMSERAFVIYKLVAMLFQAETVAVPMQGFTHDLDAMQAAITPRTRLVFVANPNNPTGTRVDAAALDLFVRSMPDHVITVIDEAYFDLLPEAEQPDSIAWIREGLPVCILRTFSKIYGLAGLRIGYSLASPELTTLLNRARQPFNVNDMAQIAAIAAIGDDDHVAAARKMVADGLRQITDSLTADGVEFVPSCVNFLLVKVGPGRDICKALEQRHVIVRPMDGYGLPEYIRVTVGTETENTRFLNALKQVLHG